MRVALVVCAKELRQRLRDRTAIILAFVAPTVLAAIVTGAFGSGFGPDDFDMTVAVFDADDSTISSAFREQVLGAEQLRDDITVKRAASEADAKASVERGDVQAAFVIPEGFEANVTAGRRARFVVYRNAAAAIQGEIAEAIASAFTQQVNATRLSVFTAVRASATAQRSGAASGTADAATIGRLAAEAARDRIPVVIADRTSAPATNVSGANYFAPGMAIFFLFFTVGAGARSLLAEKEQGTMPRVLAAPAGRWSIVAGKALAMFVLGIGSMTSVLVFTGLLFDVEWGDPVAVAVLTVVIVLAVMSVSALVQTLAKTEQQAANYGSGVGFVLALFGGNFFPLFQLPGFVQRISALTPNGWALRGFTDIAYDGSGLAQLLPNLAAISAFVAVCGTLAALQARKITVAA